MITAAHRRRKLVLTVAALGASTVLLAGCTGGGNSSSSSPEAFTYLSFTENETIGNTLTSLSTGACSAENEALPLEITKQPQASYDQQLQLLAGQNALPVLFASGNSPDVAKELNDSGQVLDIAAALDKLGVSDDLLPAASSTISSLYGSVIALPTELNVEGIWYNKQLLADNGIEAPATWDELSDAAAQIETAGVTPFAAAGKDGWPITRLVGNYIFRTLGSDAMQKVADGKAKLTDPEYVAAAAAVADLGAAGYFGEGIGSIDYAAALNEFATGKAAFFYMGSWTLANFNDAEATPIGADNIGFVPFPSVDGSSQELAANVGVPLAVSEKLYDDKVGAWLKCIAENFGSTSLSESGVLTGFAVNDAVDVPQLTQQVQEQIDSSSDSVLWFEALFNAQATTTSTTNAAQLVTGAITPDKFMQLIQSDLD